MEGGVIGFGLVGVQCCKTCIVSLRLLFDTSISGLVVEYIVAIDVTRVRFPADALRIIKSIITRRSSGMVIAPPPPRRQNLVSVDNNS